MIKILRVLKVQILSEISISGSSYGLYITKLLSTLTPYLVFTLCNVLANIFTDMAVLLLINLQSSDCPVVICLRIISLSFKY